MTQLQDYVKQLDAEVPAFQTALSNDRLGLLKELAQYLASQVKANKPGQVLFVCTHNSRRSQFSQVWFQILATYYGFEMLKGFSAGTEVTAFHPNTLVPFKNLGLSITTEECDTSNPKYHLKYEVNDHTGSTLGFSKLIQDNANPTNEFCAVMTCSSAEKACPFVFGADLSIPLTFEDPKRSDGTPEQDAIYTKTSHDIALHLATVFHLMKQEL